MALIKRRMIQAGHSLLTILSPDSTPGGASSALLLEDNFGLLLENGDHLLLEA